MFTRVSVIMTLAKVIMTFIRDYSTQNGFLCKIVELSDWQKYVFIVFKLFGHPKVENLVQDKVFFKSRSLKCGFFIPCMLTKRCGIVLFQKFISYFHQYFNALARSTRYDHKRIRPSLGLPKRTCNPSNDQYILSVY
jgi:Na+-transporting NADH:ubiquinone oxidoreductase subunit NqrE